MRELDYPLNRSIARALKLVLQKLKELNAPYNFYFQYGVRDLHLHIEIVPRFSKVKWAGFEMCTGTIINPVSPEAAAEYYRA
jgi:galactose-1-phosphate uridylyltransferase